MNAIDFLGREIKVGDTIVYPVSDSFGSAYMVRATVEGLTTGKNISYDPVPVLLVRSTEDSRNQRYARAARPIRLRDPHRSVVVS